MTDKLTYAVVLDATPVPPLIWRIYSGTVAVLVPLAFLGLLTVPFTSLLLAPGLDTVFRVFHSAGVAFIALLVVPPIAWCSWMMHREFCKGNDLFGVTGAIVTSRQSATAAKRASK